MASTLCEPDFSDRFQSEARPCCGNRGHPLATCGPSSEALRPGAGRGYLRRRQARSQASRFSQGQL